MRRHIDRKASHRVRYTGAPAASSDRGAQNETEEGSEDSEVEMEEESDRFDAIIIGAGPAGIACAYTLAKAGKEVLVIERGDEPGAKNMTGGRLYSYALEQVEPGFTARAEQALERKITVEQMMLLDGERGVTIGYSDRDFAGTDHTAPLSYSIIRGTFDKWFSEQAEEAGAMVACGVRVDGLIEEEGRVIGVKAGDDEMLADVVIAADGINSLIAQSVGLVPEIEVSQVCVGAKETIELPKGAIEQRFGCPAGEGAARLILGGVSGVNGGGIIYTNRTSVSLGCVLMPAALASHRLSIADAVQAIKTHPAIAPLIEGGKTIEYSAHICGEAGLKAIPDKLGKPGLLVVGDAAGLCINQGYTVRGIDLAILSGLAAAGAILDDGGDEPTYRHQLKSLGVMRAMEMARKFPDIEDDPRIFNVYPEMVCNVFDTVYQLDPNSKIPLYRKLKSSVKASSSFRALFKDVRKITSAIKQEEL